MNNKEDNMNTFRKVCYVVVNLPKRLKEKNVCILWKHSVYNHSGDDSKEDPPVPIPNTEVKLFYAESTYG